MAVVGTESAAQRLGVSVRRVRAMISSGLLRATKVGRDWAIEEADLQALQARDRKRGRPPKGPSRKK